MCEGSLWWLPRWSSLKQVSLEYSFLCPSVRLRFHPSSRGLVWGYLSIWTEQMCREDEKEGWGNGCLGDRPIKHLTSIIYISPKMLLLIDICCSDDPFLLCINGWLVHVLYIYVSIEVKEPVILSFLEAVWSYPTVPWSRPTLGYIEAVCCLCVTSYHFLQAVQRSMTTAILRPLFIWFR